MTHVNVFLLIFFTCLSGAFASDWVSHKIEVPDTRFSPAPISKLEVMELPYTGSEAPQAVLLMLSGFFQNASLFDLMPEKKISLARYFMTRFRIKIYVLHLRGIGGSDKVKRVNLDDYAVDDLPAALRWLAKREKRKLITFGHSQGGIIMKASLAGLSRCGARTNCFRPESAAARQELVEAAAASGANVALTALDPDNQLKVIGLIARPVIGAIESGIDEIKVATLLQNPLFETFAYLRHWELLYHRENVDREAMKSIYTRTIDGTSSTVLAQFIDGINGQGIRAVKLEGHGQKYADHLKNIKLPYANVTYEVDQISEPQATFEDDFTNVGSFRKRFFIAPRLGHEDFMMNRNLHMTWDEAMTWILRVRR